MESDCVCQGRSISTAELDWLRQAVAIHSDWSQKRLARELCQRWQWRTAQGCLKDFAARSLLLKLYTRSLVVLPPLRAQYQTRRWESRPPPSQLPPVATGIEGPLDGLQPLRWGLLLAGSLEEDRGHEHLRGHHYLGLHVVGESLKYLVQTRDGEDVACLLFGAAVWQSAARDKFIGWTAAQRAQGLSQVVNALAAKGSPIGTGAMESTCGQLQTRVKRTGQFWKPAGLTNMLALKAALQNDDWLALWSRN